ncbi:MAG: thioredoxin family protein, partial [Alphaproteobacteria bacterium]
SAIRDHVAAGRTVFVDVTADWCITCQANKKLVLNRDEVAKRMEDPSLVAMRADWTRPDAAIAKFLADHGRYGIPFNIVYGPGAPDGIALPELLSDGAVLEALSKAAGKGMGKGV